MGRCKVLQCVAVCCSVLQCVVVCCSVLVSDPGEVMLDISFYTDIGVYIEICVQIAAKKTLVQ